MENNELIPSLHWLISLATFFVGFGLARAIAWVDKVYKEFRRDDHVVNRHKPDPGSFLKKRKEGRSSGR